MKMVLYNRYLRFIEVLLCVCLLLSLVSCAGSNSAGVPTKVQNLEKLCKVWGYTKYTHSAFLLGKKDWDAELLGLIPTVSAAKENQVDGILHEWFASLGEIDYGTSGEVSDLPEELISVQADISWISEDYLGGELSGDLSQLGKIPRITRREAPVQFVTNSGQGGLPDFSNEKVYEDMDYGDTGYRLLALFRLWNAMEYNYPYLDILDENWHELLPGAISQMLEGTDRYSYEKAIATLAAKLQDNHITLNNVFFMAEEIGRYGAPVQLTEAEGKFVVWKVMNANCPLQVGDVICKVEDKKIDDVVKHRRQYIATTTEDKLVNSLGHFLLRSPNEEFEVTVLRDGKEQTFLIKGEASIFVTLATATMPYEILDENIGLLNPAAFEPNGLAGVMQELQSTDGLIIDLRQYPAEPVTYELAQYLVEDTQQFVTYAVPAKSMPGIFKKNKFFSGSTELSKAQLYEKPVVVLMDQKTQSRAEYTVMSIRNGKMSR